MHGGVFDVTRFVREHPGGIGALAAAGRAGSDVTAHFERIGHSAAARKTLATLKIGVVAATAVGAVTLAPLPPAPIDDESVGVRWHNARRVAILAAHPEMETLMGPSPCWTLALGLVACCTHSAALVYTQTLTACQCVALAYTLGAFCKFQGFAVAHESPQQRSGLRLFVGKIMRGRERERKSHTQPPRRRMTFARGFLTGGPGEKSS